MLTQEKPPETVMLSVALTSQVPLKVTAQVHLFAHSRLKMNYRISDKEVVKTYLQEQGQSKHFVLREVKDSISIFVKI